MKIVTCKLQQSLDRINKQYVCGVVQTAQREGDQDSRVAVGFLVVAFVVLHVQGHLANLTVETSFVPVLEMTHTYTYIFILSVLDVMNLFKPETHASKESTFIFTRTTLFVFL